MVDILERTRTKISELFANANNGQRGEMLKPGEWKAFKEYLNECERFGVPALSLNEWLLKQETKFPDGAA